MKSFFIGLLISLYFAAQPNQTEPCPLPFTQEQLNEQLAKVICAAPNDFAGVLGEKDSESDYNIFWKTKDISINGTTDIFISLDNTNRKDNPRKEFVAMFTCPDVKDKQQFTAFYELFRQAINIVKPACVTLTQNESIDDLRPDLLKSIVWEGDANSASGTKVHVQVELDLNFFGGEYYVNLHVSTT